LAEVIGTAIALDLLFGIPLQIGVFITAADVFLILWLQSKGFRKIEALIMAFLAVITVCFIAQIALADPDWQGVFKGFIPHTTIFTNPEMLYLALGIIGATVMPHNLYLHSAIVQTRAIDNTDKAKKEAIRYATYDSTFALCLALIINAAILILAASSFHLSGHHDIATIEEAHGLLTPLLGSTLAPLLFGVALLCCGLSSTVTATMAGQVVMEGFINWRIQPWLRRLITRAVAIVPAAAVTIYFGETGTGKLLILSQVILSLQLPFAIVPLIYFTADRRKMGAHTAPRLLTAIATLIACLIIGLNMKMLGDYFFG
jgi:manganese transport protein